jgi:hypothetical protein
MTADATDEPLTDLDARLDDLVRALAQLDALDEQAQVFLTMVDRLSLAALLSVDQTEGVLQVGWMAELGRVCLEIHKLKQIKQNGDDDGGT